MPDEKIGKSVAIEGTHVIGPVPPAIDAVSQEIGESHGVRGRQKQARVRTACGVDAVEHRSGVGKVLDHVAGDNDVDRGERDLFPGKRLNIPDDQIVESPASVNAFTPSASLSIPTHVLTLLSRAWMEVDAASILAEVDPRVSPIAPRWSTCLSLTKRRSSSSLKNTRRRGAASAQSLPSSSLRARRAASHVQIRPRARDWFLAWDARSASTRSSQP